MGTMSTAHQEFSQSNVCSYFRSDSVFEEVNKKFFELKNVEYRDGIKARRQDRDDYVH